MAESLFFEDFDENGVGFGGPVFESWSIGGVPVDAGHWSLFYPDIDDGENKTPGSGRYAGVRANSFEFIDSLVWLISPLIDTRTFKDLVLSADVHFRASGMAQGEDKVEVLALPVGSPPHLIGSIGDTMNHVDPPISERMSWNFSIDQGGMIQIAFSWYSSMGPPEFDSIQLDNIRLEGLGLSVNR